MTSEPGTPMLAPGGRPFHPRHGTHDPVDSTPPRRPGSIRRTSSIAMLRPGGILEDLVLEGYARDLLTGPDGSARVVGEARMRVRIGFVDGRAIKEIETTPHHPETAKLIGVPASSGYRAALEAAVPEHRGSQSLLYLLLDDVPVAALVSGYAIGYSMGDFRKAHKPAGPSLQHPDLCAGWMVGGTILQEIEQHGSSPVVTGPHAPSFLREDDPIGWHELPPLPAHGMRRHRRLDLTGGDPLGLDVHFRDSHMTETGEEQIIHEYLVQGTVDPRTLTIGEIGAEAKALPWAECPLAVASAGRLAGMPVMGLRPKVRDEFTGPTTCTHLNDTLRSIEDVEALAGMLASAGLAAPAAWK